jgi:hypothetical protein
MQAKIWYDEVNKGWRITVGNHVNPMMFKTEAEAREHAKKLELLEE